MLRKTNHREAPMGAAINGRTCDTCTACCFTHAVTTIAKPGSEWCPHCEIGSGCRIYAARPEQCREFSCHWLQGWASENDRPDRLKVVLGGIDVNVAGRRVRLVQFIETAMGAMDQDHLTELIAMFRAKSFGICIACLLPSGRTPMRLTRFRAACSPQTRLSCSGGAREVGILV
jgi:hypothetical protein